MAMTALLLAACAATPVRPPPAWTTTPAEARDERAVLAALQRLDVCAVLTGATAEDPTFGQMTTWAPDPTTCARIVDESTESPKATLGFTILTSDLKQAIEQVTLSGAKAYLLPASDDTCTVSLPVSYTYAINISIVDKRQEADSCGVAKAVGAAAATALTSLGDVYTTPMWDPCTAQERLPGKYVDEQQRRNCMGGVVTFSYDPMPETTHTVGDHPVAKLEVGSTCSVTWRLGSAPGTYADGPDLLATVRQPDCAAATEAAEILAPMLAEPPPTVVAPQQPLLYKPNEKDTP